MKLFCFALIYISTQRSIQLDSKQHTFQCEILLLLPTCCFLSHIMFSILFSSPRFRCVRVHCICAAAYVFIFIAIYLLWGIITKDLEIFSQIHITSAMYHFCGLFFSCIITVRFGDGGGMRTEETFSLYFFSFISFKTKSHRNENFLISLSYYYETELSVEAKKKMKKERKNFPSEFSPVPHLLALALSHSLLIKRFKTALLIHNKQNFVNRVTTTYTK